MPISIQAQALLNTKLYKANLKIKLLPTLAKYYALRERLQKSRRKLQRYYYRINDSLTLLEKERGHY